MVRPLCPTCKAEATTTSSPNWYTCVRGKCHVVISPLRRVKRVVPPDCRQPSCYYAAIGKHPEHGVCKEPLCLDRTMPHGDYHKIGWRARLVPTLAGLQSKVERR